MHEILTDRKNKGNVTYRISVTEDNGVTFVHVEKLMKVRSVDSDKKTTKKLVYQNNFSIKDFEKIRNDIDDAILLQFCIDTILKVKS